MTRERSYESRPLRVFGPGIKFEQVAFILDHKAKIKAKKEKEGKQMGSNPDKFLEGQDK